MNAQHTYVKALKLRGYTDIETIEGEIATGNIVILKITPLVVEDAYQVREVIRELQEIVERIGGDIARLGEERIVLTPKAIKIWRGHKPEGIEEVTSTSETQEH